MSSCRRPAVGRIMDVAGYDGWYSGTGRAGCGPWAIPPRATLSARGLLMQIKDGSAETVCDI